MKTLSVDERPADHCISFRVTPDDLASMLYPDMGTAEAADSLATVRLVPVGAVLRTSRHASTRRHARWLARRDRSSGAGKD